MYTEQHSMRMDKTLQAFNINTSSTTLIDFLPKINQSMLWVLSSQAV